MACLFDKKEECTVPEQPEDYCFCPLGFEVRELNLPLSGLFMFELTAVYNEDLLESIVNLTKFHLAHNVYAFHDARFAGTNRPPLGEGGQPSVVYAGGPTSHGCQSC